MTKDEIAAALKLGLKRAEKFPRADIGEETSVVGERFGGNDGPNVIMDLVWAAGKTVTGERVFTSRTRMTPAQKVAIWTQALATVEAQ